MLCWLCCVVVSSPQWVLDLAYWNRQVIAMMDGWGYGRCDGRYNFGWHFWQGDTLVPCDMTSTVQSVDDPLWAIQHDLRSSSLCDSCCDSLVCWLSGRPPPVIHLIPIPVVPDYFARLCVAFFWRIGRGFGALPPFWSWMLDWYYWIYAAVVTSTFAFVSEKRRVWL